MCVCVCVCVCAYVCVLMGNIRGRKWLESEDKKEIIYR
jgi:hypothetical protein